MSKTSAAVKNRYNAKKYDMIRIAVPKGQKATLQAVAAQTGESVNHYIARAILAQMGVDDWPGIQDKQDGAE